MISSVKEALELEELENQIEGSVEGLVRLTEAYTAYLRKITTYIKEYTDKILSFTDMMNKEIDALYSGMDAFDTYNLGAKEEIQRLKADLKEMPEDSENPEILALKRELEKKLASEIQSVTGEADYRIDTMLKEYKKVSERLARVSERLAKLKTKELLK